MVLTRLGPAGARETIVEAFRRNLVDPFLISLEDVEEVIREGESSVGAYLEDLAPTHIDDAVEELRHWVAFRQEDERQAGPSEEVAGDFAGSTIGPAMTDDGAPIASRGRRVGRNEPCPCGSGKKYKKCCGAR